jgi:succinoglycan biosynthesis transport protein ExoP
MMSGQMGEFMQYVRAVQKRIWIVLLCGIIAAGAVYYHMGTVPMSYSSSAVLRVTAPLFSRTPTDDAAFVQRQTEVTNEIVQLIGSRSIAARVASKLGLAGPGTVQAAISAQPVRGTSLVRVTATAGNPQDAARLANTTAEEFMIYFRDANRSSVAETRRFIEDQLAVARARLDATERALQAFKENRQMPVVGAATSQVVAEVASGRAALEAAQLQRQEIEVRLDAARARLAKEEPIIVASQATAANPVFQQIQARLVALEIERTQLSQVYTPQHPRMDQISREIADVRGRLMNEARTSLAQEVTTNNPVFAGLVTTVASLEVDRVAASARIQALQGIQRRRQAEAMAIPATETEFNRLTRENRMHESTYAALSNRYQEVLLRENEAGFFPAGLQLIEAAVPPARATTTSSPRAAAAAGAVGLVLGLVAALFLEALDDRIRGAQDAERVLGVPVLAEIPLHGVRRTAPSPATVLAIILLAAALAAAGVMAGRRGDVRGAVVERARSMVAVVTFWTPNGGAATVQAAPNGR